MSKFDRFIVVVAILSIAISLLIFSFPLVKKYGFYKGQANQICDGEVETIYVKDNNHFVLCANKTIHKLLDED
jgi:hypothetical protein